MCRNRISGSGGLLDWRKTGIWVALAAVAALAVPVTAQESASGDATVQAATAEASLNSYISYVLANSEEGEAALPEAAAGENAPEFLATGAGAPVEEELASPVAFSGGADLPVVGEIDAGQNEYAPGGAYVGAVGPTPATDPRLVPVAQAADPLGGDTLGEWFVYADDVVVFREPRRDAWILGRVDPGFMLVGQVLQFPESGEEWLCFAYNGKAGYVPRGALYRIHPSNRAGGDLPFGQEVVNRWWGLPSHYEPSDLQAIPVECKLSAERPLTLRTEALEAFIAMVQAGEAEGVRIRATSAYRSWWTQRDLYIRAVTKDGLNQRHTAPPGHSEHQLGTTVDIVDGGGQYILSPHFHLTKEGRWMEQNAGQFGFVRSYYEENAAETGYISEPWHWRYVGFNVPQGADAPVAKAVAEAAAEM